MTLSHSIALDLNNQQDTLFRQHAGWSRFAWNWGVAESRRALDAGERNATSEYRLRPLFTKVRAELAPWSSDLCQYAAKYALDNLGNAWTHFWKELKAARNEKRTPRRNCGRPRFHKRSRGMAFRADNGHGTVRIEDQRIRLPVIGWVRLCERWRFSGTIRKCVVKHDGKRWKASVVCEAPTPPPKATGAVLGVDVGLRRLATVHDGEHADIVENPRALKAALADLRRVNRKIARSKKLHGKDKRSQRRQKLYARRRRLYHRVAAICLDAAHKATTAIAKRARVICVETLNVAGWMKLRSLARATAEAAPGRFLRLLAQKCEREGALLVAVGRFYPSSKTCSTCGEINSALEREERWECPTCSTVHQRDDNAALNLHRQGLAVDVKGVSDGQTTAVPCEASTR